jgi:hypothetical protein
MLDFHAYALRHGEFAIQAIIESLERYEGVRANAAASLEDRWNALMQRSPSPQRRAS